MEILFFAIIAIIIFIRLFSQFGKVDEDQKREAIKKFLQEQEILAKRQQEEQMRKEAKNQNVNADPKMVDVSPNQDQKEKEEQNALVLENVHHTLKESLLDIFKKTNLAASEFVKGASLGFETVIDAFSKGDKQILQNLLSEDLYNKFVAAIDDRNESGKLLNVNIISLSQPVFKEAVIDGNNVKVVVNFASRQIIYSTNQDGNVVDGSKERIIDVSDNWTFAKDITSKDPNWRIVSTKS